jgi:hypothetical protein
MKFGNLTFTPINQAFGKVAPPTQAIITRKNISDIWVSAIDPNLADTAAFCEHYDIGMDVSANCVIVEAKRADRTRYAACLILATTKATVINPARVT